MNSKQRKIRGIILMGICLVLLCYMLTACSMSSTEQVQPTIQYEKDDTTNHTYNWEKDDTTNHTHNWEKAENTEEILVETIPLQSFACEGVERVYLIRTRTNWSGNATDYYIASDKNFNDIEITTNYGYKIVIEYILNGKPRLEKYQESQKYCSECGECFVREKYTYKFCIPEGSYLVRFE